jgi:hypothetical protein
MFGIPKRKAEPLGPFEFEHSTKIARPAAEVYALVDWATRATPSARLATRLSGWARPLTGSGCTLTWSPTIVLR